MSREKDQQDTEAVMKAFADKPGVKNVAPGGLGRPFANHEQGVVIIPTSETTAIAMIPKSAMELAVLLSDCALEIVNTKAEADAATKQ